MEDVVLLVAQACVSACGDCTVCRCDQSICRADKVRLIRLLVEGGADKT